MFFIEERINNKVIRFYNPIYTKKGNVEFKGTTMDKTPNTIIYLNDELYLKIKNNSFKYKISAQNKIKLDKFKETMIEEINSFWKRIISDQEELIFLKVSKHSDKYLLTTQTILEKGYMSPKFNQGLEYVFSEHIVGKQFYQGNFSDLLYFLSNKINRINNKGLDEFRIKYSLLIEKLKN